MLSRAFRYSATVLLVTAVTAPSHALSLYHVGNSLTFDSKPDGTAAMLERVLGEPIELGYHIRGNQTLNSLWTNPTAQGTFTTTHGDHTVALPNNAWDYLVLQSFPSITEPKPTLGQELARIHDFVAAADQGNGGQTEVVVYGPWAGISENAWRDWYQPFPNDPEELSVYSAAYQDLLYDEVAASYPGRTRLASAGKVIREVRDQILDGSAPIASLRDLYRRDGVDVHLEETLGRFVASMTVQTVILGKSQVSQPPPSVPGWGWKRFSGDAVRWAQLTAWEVLLADERSGIADPAPGDYDGNGTIDYSDLSVYYNSYGSTEQLLADGNGNGFIDAGDKQVWEAAVAQAGGLDPVAGDVDGNGVIDRADLGLLQFEYGSTGRDYADLNHDGVVNVLDYVAWRTFRDEAYASVAIPEPTGLASLLAGGCLLGLRRRVA